MAFEMLGGERYRAHADAIERMSAQVQTEGDYERMGKLFVGIYEAGFLKSVDEHRTALEKAGYRVNISRPVGINPDAPKIF